MNPSGHWYDLSPAATENLITELLVTEPDIVNDKNSLKNILSCIDLTTLEGSDNHEKIVQLCNKAISSAEKGLPLPAAV